MFFLAAQKADHADIVDSTNDATTTAAATPPATPPPAPTPASPYELRALLSHRSAIVKFKRQSDVVFGMKQLRLNPAQSTDLQGVLVSRYRPVVQDGLHDIDEDGDDEAFDRYGLTTILRDYMYADPATRYQIAQNYFERSLVDAQALDRVEMLLDPTVTKEVRDEANSLMKMGKKMDTASRQRLFELYIQREELSSFVHDFRELEMYFGAANPSDDFDWSQFRVEEWEDIAKIQANMKLADEKFMQTASSMSGHNDTMGAQGDDRGKTIHPLTYIQIRIISHTNPLTYELMIYRRLPQMPLLPPTPPLVDETAVTNEMRRKSLSQTRPVYRAAPPFRWKIPPI